jgi:hypothetical protein
MSVKARDNDCTNDGYACVYKLVPPESIANLDMATSENIDAQMPFKIDNTGSLSTTRPLVAGKIYDFKVRAFDCISKDSYVEAQVHIEVIERCSPQWIGKKYVIFVSLSLSLSFSLLLIIINLKI